MLDIAEAAVAAALARLDARPANLVQAVRYAVGAPGEGGKRIRPQLCLASCVAACGAVEDATHPAAAIELLHNYTLVHDDLPAMDDDAERRGRPSVWAKFGQADAILAGDALQALAFSEAAMTPRGAGEVVAALAEAAYGVVAGQVEDVAATADTQYIYRHKTADLFIAAARMGAIAAGAGCETVDRLGDYALAIGLAFQHRDDMLDGDSPYPPAETAALVERYTADALAALDSLPGDCSFLRSLALSLSKRSM